MGGGNGAKAKQKRERNLKNAGNEGKSQLKTNQEALNKQCALCPTRLHTTCGEKAFQVHVDTYHSGHTIMEAFEPYLKKKK